MSFPYRNVLFVCHGNALRSQMAEGLFRSMAPEGVNVRSAGILPTGVDRHAQKIMNEIGIDISKQWSKDVREIDIDEIDLIITLTEGIDESFPQIRSAEADHLHWPMPNPYASMPIGADGLDAFRAIRDEMKLNIRELLDGNDGEKGFTLMEILVAVGIISVLTVIGVVALGRARAAALETTARAELSQIRKAIEIMEQDTGKWPNGCPPWSVQNPEIDLNAASAGLTAQPSVGVVDDPCIWTATDVSDWDGPYVQNTLDPWDNPYYFDPDYTPYLNCSSEATLLEGVYLVSPGEDFGGDINEYDCDDIFLKLL